MRPMQTARQVAATDGPHAQIGFIALLLLRGHSNNRNRKLLEMPMMNLVLFVLGSSFQTSPWCHRVR